MKLKLKFGQDNVLKPLLSTAVLKSGVAANILEAEESPRPQGRWWWTPRWEGRS